MPTIVDQNPCTIQKAAETYTLSISGIKDYSGNYTDSTTTVEAVGSSQADSSGPQLTWSYPANGSRGIPLESSIMLGFSEAVILTDIPRAVTVFDADSLPIKGQWTYPASSLTVFKSTELLISKMDYLVQVCGDSLKDIFGNKIGRAHV